MPRNIDFVVWIVVIGLFVIVNLIRKILEKAGGAARGPARGPGRPQARDVGKEIRDFLEQLGKELEGGGKPRGRPEGAPPPVPPRRAGPRPRPKPREVAPARVERVELPTIRPETARVGKDLGKGATSAAKKVARVAESEIGAVRRIRRVRRKKPRGAGRTAPVPLPSLFALKRKGVSREVLREAVVWAEILGKPRSLRGFHLAGRSFGFGPRC